MRFHIQARADELEQSGLAGSDALRQARREFGSTLRSGEATRSAWQMFWLEDLASDVRYAARALRRNPALALAAVASLALGIGANTTIFSVAREALFSEPSCRDPQSLVQVSTRGNSWVSMAQYRFLEHAHVFDAIAGVNIGMVVNWRNGNRSYRLAGTHVTDSFFEVVGIPVAMGRPIERGETDVTVVTYGFWRKRLGGAPNVLGRTLVLDGKPYTVVGVLPRDHRMLAGFGFTPDLYLTKDPGEVMLYARLPQGIGRQAAYARLAPICRELDRVYPDVNRKWAKEVRLSAVGGTERLEGEVGQQAIPVVGFFAMLVIVTAIVVLIACANISSLLLARSFTRAREFAIRMSLGGSRSRLVRQLLAESMLLALLGTGAGLALNLWLTRLLSGIHIPTPLPIELVFQPDRLLLLYSVAIAIVVTVTTGLVPALRATGAGIGAALKAGGRKTGPAGSTLRNALVIGQLAVSIVLLSAGLLFLRNLIQATSFKAGFDTSHTIEAMVQGPSDRRKFVDSALERLRALPGIEAASPAYAVPLNPFLAFSRERGPLRPDAGSRSVRVEYNSNSVGPDYFRIMAIPILDGRTFLDSDRAGAPEVAILNENMAHRLFGDTNPVGHILRFPDNRDARVVGIARNSTYVNLGEKDAMALYVPFSSKTIRLCALLRAHQGRAENHGPQSGRDARRPGRGGRGGNPFHGRGFRGGVAAEPSGRRHSGIDGAVRIDARFHRTLWSFAVRHPAADSRDRHSCRVGRHARQRSGDGCGPEPQAGDGRDGNRPRGGGGRRAPAIDVSGAGGPSGRSDELRGRGLGACAGRGPGDGGAHRSRAAGRPCGGAAARVATQSGGFAGECPPHHGGFSCDDGQVHARRRVWRLRMAFTSTGFGQTCSSPILPR